MTAEHVKPEKVLVRPGCLPHWMVPYGCAYHTYACTGHEWPCCIPIYAMKKDVK